MQNTIDELLQSNFIQSIEGDTILFFNGVMSQDSIVGMGEVLRNELHQYYPLNVVNKIFAIYVEMTQNVLHYSHQKMDTNGKSTGKGSVLVFSVEDGYKLVTVNLVSENQKNHLLKKHEMVNNLSPEELKEFYLRRRRKVVDAESKGAGLGFIDIARRSSNPLEFVFQPAHDDLYYFYFSSKVTIE